MLFPYSTDAPIYYWPFATVVLIGLNVVIFMATMAAVQTPGGEEIVRAWCLELGGGLHPLQWVSCNFLHADIMHLVGNMFGLWAFGLITEGKIGWWRFLVIYLGIGTLVMMIAQIVSLGSEPTVGLGASGAVFGLLAMCLIWAPENEFSCFIWLFFRPITFEMQVRVMAVIYIGLNLTILFITKEAVSAEAVHLLGAVAGFAVAVVMLRKGWVDCENWDAFSVWAGRHTMSPEEIAEAEQEKRESKLSEEEKNARRQQKQQSALGQINALIEEGNIQLALAAHARLANQFNDWRLPESVHYRLLAELLKTDHGVDPVPFAVDYLRHHNKAVVAVRLKLAETLIRKQQRPAQALKVLAKLPRDGLPAKMQAFRQRLEKEAAIGIRTGLLETATEDW